MLTTAEAEAIQEKIEDLDRRIQFDWGAGGNPSLMIDKRDELVAKLKQECRQESESGEQP